MQQQGHQFLSWLTLVVMPYIVLISGFLAVTGRGKRDFAGKTFKLGLEACILGVGLAAALLGNQETQTAWQIASVAIGFGFLLIVVYGLVNESEVRRTRKARLSIMFSTLVFGANTAIHAAVYKPGSTISPIVAGFSAWIVPCLGFNFMVRDNKRPEFAEAGASVS